MSVDVVRCPICNGTGLVSRPPGVAGDQQTFSSSSCGPWRCSRCDEGVIYVERVVIHNGDAS